MLESIDLHLQDLFQNALTAGATAIHVRLECDEAQDQLLLSVADDGAGMSAEQIAAVRRGYYSSKSQENIGLGIPLLRFAAEHCEGSFSIDSEPGQGTTVTATFRQSHIDVPPLGDLASTFLSMLVTSEGRSVSITYCCRDQALSLNTDALAEMLGPVPLSDPEVILFLQEYIGERLGGRNEAGGSP